jgi:hypothetical protein
MVLAYVVSLQYAYVEVMQGSVVSTSSAAIAMRRNSRRHVHRPGRAHYSSMHARSVHLPQVPAVGLHPPHYKVDKTVKAHNIMPRNVWSFWNIGVL